MNDIFKEYRFNKHHLALGDIWLTIAQQDEINDELQALLRVARAARDCHEVGLIRSVPWTMGTRDSLYPIGELLKALEEVEHLLD